MFKKKRTRRPHNVVSGAPTATRRCVARRRRIFFFLNFHFFFETNFPISYFIRWLMRSRCQTFFFIGYRFLSFITVSFRRLDSAFHLLFYYTFYWMLKTISFGFAIKFDQASFLSFCILFYSAVRFFFYGFLMRFTGS